MNPKSIWNEKQNKPTYIVRDLAQYLGADLAYEILLRRGVFKWLAVRRDLISIKNTWKTAITKSIISQVEAKRKGDFSKNHYYRGYRKALEECRADIRKMCHSERWRAPDFDVEAVRWLARRTENDANVHERDLETHAPR